MTRIFLSRGLRGTRGFLGAADSAEHADFIWAADFADCADLSQPRINADLRTAVKCAESGRQLGRRVLTMTNTPSVSAVEGDEEVLLYLLQFGIGAPVWVAATWLVPDRLVGNALGFVAAWTAVFPIARRTWAAQITARRYIEVVFVAAALATALSLLFQ